MRFLMMLFAVGLMACSAHAQFGRDDRTRDEIAFERAVTEQAAQRAERADAIRACAGNDGAACYKLGEFYRRGVGGLQDYEKAAEAYRSACRAGDGAGCAGVGYLFMGGKGVDTDFAQARLFYEKACTLDEVSGCAAYGNLLFIGKGGSKDVPRGTTYLTNACDQEYEWACTRILELGAYDRDDDTWDRLKDWKTRNF